MKKRKIDPLEEIMSNPYYQLRDDYNYAEKVKGTISFGQYSMKYWALERDIVLDGTKSEITEERFVKAIMDARKEGEILNDEDEVNGARKIRRKVISHLNIIFCGKAANHGLSSPPARSFRATCTRKQGHRHGLKATSRFTRDITPR